MGDEGCEVGGRRPNVRAVICGSKASANPIYWTCAVYPVRLFRPLFVTEILGV